MGWLGGEEEGQDTGKMGRGVPASGEGGAHPTQEHPDTCLTSAVRPTEQGQAAASLVWSLWSPQSLHYRFFTPSRPQSVSKETKSGQCGFLEALSETQYNVHAPGYHSVMRVPCSLPRLPAYTATTTPHFLSPWTAVFGSQPQQLACEPVFLYSEP